jgi:hypothetical protein
MRLPIGSAPGKYLLAKYFIDHDHLCAVFVIMVVKKASLLEWNSHR